MGKIIKIAVYLAVLFLLYLWIASVAKSCSPQESTSSSTASVDQVENYETTTSDEFEDDFFEVQPEGQDEMGGAMDIVEESDPIDYTEVDEIIDNKETATEFDTPIEEKVKPSTSSTSTSINNGNFMLLAGSYLIEDNAKIMVGKLKNMGYSNAEVVVFDMSQYYSVCAGRYNSLSSAQQQSSSLKRKGIDNYVHTKQ